MGVIEIYTKSGQRNNDMTTAKGSKSGKNSITEPGVEGRYVRSKGTILWVDDIHTDSTGKAKINLDGVKSPGNVIITIEGCTDGGLTGTTSIEYDMQ